MWGALSDTNTSGQQAFLIIGHSIARGTASGWQQPTPTAGTVYATLDGIAINEIGADDVNPTMGYAPGTIGSAWPQAGITYYSATGKKPVFILSAVSNSVFYPNASATGGEWRQGSTNYTNAVTSANAALNTLGVRKLKGIYVNLGINDIAYSSSYANIAAAIDNMFAGLLADFPGIPIYIVQQGKTSSALDSLKMKQVAAKLKSIASANTNIYIGSSLSSYYTNSLLTTDNLHPNVAGYTTLGEMFTRLVTSTSYSKWARAIISSHHDDLSSSRKSAIDTFISTIGENAFLSIGCLYRGKTTIQQNVFVDWALMCNPVNVSISFTTNDSIDFNRATPHYIKTGFNPTNAQYQTLSDNFIGAMTKTNNIAAGTQAYLFGSYDGTTETSVYQNPSSGIVGISNGRYTIWTSGEGGDLKCQNSTSYYCGNDASNVYLYKNGSLVDQDITASIYQLVNGEIFWGDQNLNGAANSNCYDDTQLFFVSGKLSGVNLSALDTALKTLDSTW